jgi:hypothetical protein
MVVNLREQVEADLAFSLESETDWGLPVILTDPDGVEYSTYYGQILYDTLAVDPATGAQVIVHKPVVTLRVSSLTRVPADGENWKVSIPTSPDRTATKETFLLERPSEDGRSIGFIRLYLIRPRQS